MNKKDLIHEISVKSGLSIADVEKAIKNYEEVIESTLKSGEKVVSIGFGTFDIKQTVARNGRNPQTGKPMIIPAKQTVRFRPGKKLEL
jgi:DNA-binding protein HU-beta|nr:MAG TPA: DNA binding protein [Caudoviricetes sp.]